MAFAVGWSGAQAQALSPAPEHTAAQALSSDTPDADTQAAHRRTQAAIAEVLAQPEFADLRSDPDALSHRLIQWVFSLFDYISSAIGSLPEWLAWIFWAWMVLTLAAILVHLIYTLWTLVGSASRSSPEDSTARRHRGELLGIRELDFDTVYAEACRLLTVGDWMAATKYYYVAAILWLDRQGAIAFRPSKTNRDYFGELRTQTRLQGPFGRLTECFESIIYAGQTATATSSRDMAQIVEGLLHESAAN